MSYEQFMRTHDSLREQFQGDPASLAIIEAFRQEAEQLYASDEKTAFLMAHLAIQKAKNLLP